MAEEIQAYKSKDGNIYQKEIDAIVSDIVYIVNKAASKTGSSRGLVINLKQAYALVNARKEVLPLLEKLEPSRSSSEEEQLSCKEKVGSSNLSSGTNFTHNRTVDQDTLENFYRDLMKCHTLNHIESALEEYGLTVVPKEPSDSLIKSMATRMNHAYAMDIFPANQIRDEMDCRLTAAEKRGIESTVRQVHEEVVGEGFHDIMKCDK